MSNLVTLKVQPNEVVKAEDVLFGFDSQIDNMTMLLQKSIENNKNFVVGGEVTPYAGGGLNVSVAALMGVCKSTNKLFLNTEKINQLGIGSGWDVDRIDIIEVSGNFIDTTLEQRAFINFDTKEKTIQNIYTRSKLDLDIHVKHNPNDGQVYAVAPNTTSGYVKLCEIFVPANATDIDECEIYNITAEVPSLENAYWTNEKDNTYNIGTMASLVECVKNEHNSDGSHKNKTIHSKNIDFGIAANQVNAGDIPLGKEVTVGENDYAPSENVKNLVYVISELLTDVDSRLKVIEEKDIVESVNNKSPDADGKVTITGEDIKLSSTSEKNLSSAVTQINEKQANDGEVELFGTDIKLSETESKNILERIKELEEMACCQYAGRIWKKGNMTEPYKSPTSSYNPDTYMFQTKNCIYSKLSKTMSYDGVNWTKIPLSYDFGENESVSYELFSDSIILADIYTSSGYKEMYSSDDCQTWHYATIDGEEKIKFYPNFITKDNNTYVAMYYSRSTTTVFFVTSTNGLDWITKSEISLDNDISCAFVFKMDNTWVTFIGTDIDSRNSIYHSLDLSEWNLESHFIESSRLITNCYCTNGVLFATSTNASKVTNYISTDKGLTWSAISGVTTPISGVDSLGGTVVISCFDRANSVLKGYFSVDYTSWTKAHVDFNVYKNADNVIKNVNGQFYIASQDAVYIFPPTYFLASFNLRSVLEFYGNSQVKNSSKVPVCINGLWFLPNGAYRYYDESASFQWRDACFISKDGVNYVPIFPPDGYDTTFMMEGVTYFKGKFVASTKSDGMFYSDVDTLIENGWLKT